MPNYSLDRLHERAAVAKEALAERIRLADAAYVARCKVRNRNRLPAAAFCGMGRAGKDTVAPRWCAGTGTDYPGSSSQMVLPFVAHMVGDDPERVFAERHRHRPYWIEACHALREGDLLLLTRLCLGSGDVSTGIRGRQEFFAAKAAGIFDLIVWIDNPRAPVDPTVEFAASDCDVALLNYGTVDELYGKVDKLIELFRMGRKE